MIGNGIFCLRSINGSHWREEQQSLLMKPIEDTLEAINVIAVRAYTPRGELCR